MIDSFVNNCIQNKEKDAFRYIKGNKCINITFEKLLQDVFRFCHLFKRKGLGANDKVIVFILPSYELYTLMIASMMYGLNIIVIDSFNDKHRLNDMIELSKAKYLFINNKTNLLSIFLFKRLKKINISSYVNQESTEYNYSNNLNDIVLTTFTSGTTGKPKIINRSFSDLSKQISLLKGNYVFDNKEVIICMLPIYVLFSLFNGNTTCIVKHINQKNIDLVKGNIILGKISNILKIRERILNVNKLYLGGAYIYKNEAIKIIECFKDAEIYYTYGASEGVAIGVNTLQDFYLHNRFKKVSGIDIEVIDKINNVGEIVISGESVLSDNKIHKTGDIGYCDENYIYLLGRKKYSSLENNFYNYVKDQDARDKYNTDNAFTLWYKNKSYTFVKFDRKQIRMKPIDCIRVKKFTYDLKHKTKLDYSKLINKYLK